MPIPALAFLANPAFWQGVGGAASAGGFISSLFGGKKKGGETVNLEEMLPSWMKESARGLSGWAKQYLPQFAPGEAYGGAYTAGVTPYERTGLGLLGDFLGTPTTGGLYGAGKQQLLETLGGTYADVGKSPWIRSMINLSKMNLSDLINAARAQRGARGTYFTEEGIREEGDITQRTLANLDALIGQFVESERGRQYGAVGPALQYEQYGGITAPLAKIGAAETYGSLERLIEQAGLEAKYKDYQRRRKEMAMPISAMQGLAGGTQFPSTLQAPQIEQTSTLQNILNMIGKLKWSSLGGQGNIWSKLGGLFQGQ